MSKDTDKDLLFKALAKHLARIGYTASSIASMPNGFGPTTLERMGHNVLDEAERIWVLIGYSRGDWDDQIGRASKDAAAEGREWKPFEVPDRPSVNDLPACAFNGVCEFWPQGKLESGGSELD